MRRVQLIFFALLPWFFVCSVADPAPVREPLHIQLPGANFHHLEKTRQGIVARNLFPGIDLHVYANKPGLEYDFIVYPGADPDRIRFKLSPGRMQLEQGRVTIATNSGRWHHSQPHSYLLRNGHTVTSRYRMTKQGFLTIALDDFYGEEVLIIDPVVTWTHRLDGKQLDGVKAMAQDGFGNIYLAGDTYSADLPVTGGAIQKQFYPGSNNRGMFISKLNNQGDTDFTTFLDGSNQDEMKAMAVDEHGFIYITGHTTSKNLIVAPWPGVFVAKLDPGGNRILFAKTIAPEKAVSKALAVTLQNEIIVAGSTLEDIPLEQALDENRGGAASREGFLVKLSDNGSVLFSTYLGGGGDDAVTALSLDNQDNIFVTGYTTSDDFPVHNALQAKIGGLQDAFIAKYAADGQNMLFSTYLGGDDLDQGNAIHHADKKIYLAGHSTTGFPTKLSIQQDSRMKGIDGIIAVLSEDGRSLQFSSYLGGSRNDLPLAITTDHAGNIYFAGTTYSKNYPVLSPVQSRRGGQADLFFTKLKHTAAAYEIEMSSFFGGSRKEEFGDMIIQSNGDILLAGSSASPRLYATDTRSPPLTFTAFVSRIQPDDVSADVEVMFTNVEQLQQATTVKNVELLVANNGSNNATFVKVNILLPDQTTVIDSQTPGFSCFAADDHYLCVNNGMPPGSETRLNLQIRLPNTAPHTLVVESTAKEQDGNPLNNSDRVQLNQAQKTQTTGAEKPRTAEKPQPEPPRNDDYFCYCFP